MSGILGWGKASNGQLGLKGEDLIAVTTPRQISDLNAADILGIACGANYTLVYLRDGTLHSCGENEFNQLGHDKSERKFRHVDTLRGQHVVGVCCGSWHSVALSDANEIFTWGSNSHGQLGRSNVTKELRKLPRLVKHLSTNRVIQIDCGSRHCIALTIEGMIATWGANDFGQLGLGSTGGSQDTPQILFCLTGLPVAQIAAGGNHSFTLTFSGTIHGWGRNSNGQLGLGDQQDRSAPVSCRTLRSQKIRYLSCGEDHTAALNQEGRVFTFGAGSHGQLGHGNSNDVPLPCQVMELSGEEVTQIACGRRHTLAHVSRTGRMYAFGCGGSGQLGLNSAGNRCIPARVVGPFIPDVASNKASTDMAVDDVGPDFVVQQIFTGGDHCFLKYKLLDTPGIVSDFRDYNPSQILSVTPENLVQIESLESADTPPVELAEDNCHFSSGSKNHGVDLDRVKEVFFRLRISSNVVMKQKICRSIELLLSGGITPCDVEAMRVFLILPECHLFDEPKHYATLHSPLGQSILMLDKVACRFLDQWWAKLRLSCFNRLVKIYKQCVEFVLRLPTKANDFEVDKRHQAIRVCLDVLKKLNTVNEEHHQLIPYYHFYIPQLKDLVNIRSDYIDWVEDFCLPVASGSGASVQPQQQPSTYYCNYPFLFDAGTKSILLQTDASIQMRIAVADALRNRLPRFWPTVTPASVETESYSDSAMLVLMVSRSTLVRDTLSHLDKRTPAELRRPLKVVFLGEEAIDEGGVTKEFFMLLLREVLNPIYGMFKYHEESRFLWFNPETFEDTDMFHLIGTVCSLAIYNITIIDLNFPTALFRKLLERPTSLEDLRELMPTVGKNLQELLDYEEGDEEDVFCLNFVVNQVAFDKAECVELCYGGSSRTVTRESKEEFVDLYVDFILNRSVDTQFSAFRDGFLKVCSRHIMKLFHPQELQAMVIGNEEYDFEQFERNTSYKGDYYRYHETIKLFWKVFQSFNLENKKKFLLFLTGSDRVPVLGMSYIKMSIQPSMGSDNYLPVAHTCFNLLDLPMYRCQQVMEDNLLLAVQHTEGFGIV